jgi:peptidoglycan L-alanyl-D-glutamate endopeptidase CwlK
MSAYCFGIASRLKLASCHPSLIRLMTAAIETAPFDFVILEGHRDVDEEIANIKAGTSKLKDPLDCLHCHSPSRAVDIAPVPIDWKDGARFRALADHVLETAERLGVWIEWGGNWPHLRDMPHFQLAKEQP